MGFKDFLLIIILIVAIIVGYDALQGSDISLVRDIAPGIYTTPDAPVLYVAPSTVGPT